VFSIAPRRRPPALATDSSPREGRARLGRRTKELVKRLQRGEAAVIRHADLDSVAARALVACRPSFVVNAANSISGRYPNSGPSILAEAGIPLLDGLSEEAFEQLHDGDLLRLDGDRLFRNGEAFAAARRMTHEILSDCLDAGKRNVVYELRGFAENTLRHLSEEAPDLLEPTVVPEVQTKIAGRHIVIVVRGEGYRDDLMGILPYIQEERPALVAVDGSADALLELGLKPDIIFGDMDSVSDRALRCGAEIVVHAYTDGRAPGLERIHSLNQEALVFPVPGTSEDAAMLLAYERGAQMIVAVGTHFSLVDFLDKDRAGMASTFLVRLKVGSILVDAKGVSRLYRPRTRGKDVAALLIAAAVPIIMIFLLSPKLNSWLQLLRLYFRFTWRF
jgi:uncharacterized membrane-anchored protein